METTQNRKAAPKHLRPTDSSNKGAPGSRTILAGFAAPSRTVLAIVATSLFIACFDNSPFWASVLRLTESEDHRLGVLLSLFLLQVCTVIVVLALAYGTRLMKSLGALLLLFAAVCGFFMSQYGVLIDPSMVRNVVETDLKEAAPLLTGAFFMHLAVFGVLPALALTFAPLDRTGWRRGVAERGVLAALSLATLLGVVYVNLAGVTFFAREHREVRLFMNPAYPIYASLRLLAKSDDASGGPLLTFDAARSAAVAESGKHALMIFVLGETARADRFSSNGYARDTNRYTSGKGVIDFPRVSSCGTSTADSVPCLFSHLDAAHFDHATAARYESLIEMFERLSIDVLWRDNNTGCKHVCAVDSFESLADLSDPQFCDANGCYDEVLLRGLADRLADATQDHFVVLHQRGSHGPAYFTDVPGWAKEYLPECDLPDLRECSEESLDNAYDNTIAYTDYFLSKVIDFLETQQRAYDVAMFYVSDHGESLGENGIYLHGFPYSIAPIEQTHVPMMLWATDAFLARTQADPECARRVASRPYTHDSVFHTMLGLFGVRSDVYRNTLDILSPCRSVSPVPEV